MVKLTRTPVFDVVFVIKKYEYDDKSRSIYSLKIEPDNLDYVSVENLVAEKER